MLSGLKKEEGSGLIKKSDPDIIKAYLEDSSGLRGGHTKEVILPQTIEELSLTLKQAHKTHTPITLAGNGTGVTGGRIPFGGIVIGTERLNNIMDIKKNNDFNGSMRVQAGVMLKDIKEAANKINLLYPPDPTEDTAYIGGNIATNASGARGYKYGPTRKYIRLLKVVLTDGRILEIKRGQVFAKKRSLEGNPLGRIKLPLYNMPSIKNAAGYYIHDGMDLIDIFIGQEGTLGAIAEAELGLIKKEDNVFTFFAFFNTAKTAEKFVLKLREKNILSIEYFDKNSLDLLRNKFSNIPKAASGIYFEKCVIRNEGDSALEEISGLLKKASVYENTWLAENPREYKNMRAIRHGLPETINEIVKKNGFPKVGTDIAVPENNFQKMFQTYKDILAQTSMQHVIFGHIGECHLHVNILPTSDKEYNDAKNIYLKFVECALGIGGTVSAEHGIGKLKHKYLEKMYGQKGIKEMISLKKSLDPECILGLDNIFPRTLLP